jgi:sulfur-carrier protein
MAVTIRIPTTLRPLTSGQPEVDVEAGTVGEALAALDAAHPGFTERITDDSGALRRFVNVFVSDDVFVSDEDVRFLNGLDTEVPDGATVAIVPAVAGG